MPFDGSHAALARAITCLEAGVAVDLPAPERDVPVLGITGTGGSGKSSLTDELVNRLRRDQEDKVRVAILAVDPTRRKGGGALLGDRIRMNSIGVPNVFFRSLATRSSTGEVPDALAGAIDACKAAGFDLVIVETPGIGQGDAGIVPFSDVSLYVMTPEFGAASQLEKIDMLDFTDAVAINKFDRRGGADALRDVRRQMARERPEVPVFGTIASRFNDDGVTALYQDLRSAVDLAPGMLAPVDTDVSTGSTVIVPPARERYLAEIAETVRGYHAETDRAGRGRAPPPAPAHRAGGPRRRRRGPPALPRPAARRVARRSSTRSTGKDRESLSGTRVPRVALPRFEDDGELIRFLRNENVPGRFPFTAGVFPLKREDEDPARMFAGEGGPARTNRRFHLLAQDQPATRLSTAFDSVTLYGFDPDERPDIYGKVGNSGVSVATLDDMKVLFDGFDLVDPTTSVSMTINGPAPTILAMYLNAAIDQHPELDPGEVLRRVRGTVQADILKEDQGQNTCIFSTEFSLRCMADVQEWFIANEVRNFYSVSISGYHMAEAGANPITQLAFTLANGFTYVEAYLARGMDDRRLRPEPQLLLLVRDGSRVHGARARRTPHLGGDHAGAVRRERTQPEAQVPHPDVGPLAPRAGDGVQRHQDHAAGAVCGLRQRQLAAHERVRRSGDDADRGVGASGARDPAHHQPRVGTRDEREPPAGELRRRRAHRSRRGSGARRARVHLRPGWRARCDGDRLPARQDPGRVHALRAREARRLDPDRRREHVPQSRR